MHIQEYFYSVITEYAKKDGFEVAQYNEVPEILMLSKIVFCYRKTYKIQENTDIQILMYCLVNEPDKLYILVGHFDTQKYVTTKILRKDILITTYDIIKSNTQELISELTKMFDDSKEEIYERI